MLTSIQDADANAFYCGICVRQDVAIGILTATPSRLDSCHSLCAGVVLVDNQIRLVVADVGALRPDGARDRIGLQTSQGFVQLGVVICEIQSD